MTTTAYAVHAQGLSLDPFRTAETIGEAVQIAASLAATEGACWVTGGEIPAKSAVRVYRTGETENWLLDADGNPLTAYGH